MASRHPAAALLPSIGLICSGVIGVTAWRYGLWGLFTGAVLTGLWLIAVTRAATANPAPATPPRGMADPTEDAIILRILLDAAPTPLLAVNDGAVRVLNRAARKMFATDDRVLPPPADLLARDAPYLRHEGRHWRIDRVEVASADRTVVALIDIEQEERTAEARATAELIHVLGHELLNGLAPIVSLAESALAATTLPEGREMLPDILGTLARRADGLQRFTEAYRALARLPEPVRRPVSVVELVEDLARLFRGRWPDVRLDVTVADTLPAMLDRDQISQALWAILQNAAEAALAGDAPPRTSLTVGQQASYLVAEISDSGAGIARDHAGKVFRPFHTTKPDGTGIGLSLARQIVGAHGGSLALLPDPPTTFRITLPTKIDAEPPSARRL
ncbi:MAG: ATP-binding protein [Sphingomonas sp.]|uniref:sensor histidine kinase n=1 Tax=Sphingomonas sp. TaxID=28214 RepID=UPI003563896C